MKSKDRLAAVRKKLSNLTDEEKAALIQNQVILTVEGRKLSDHNAVMVVAQNEKATVVGGYNQWKKSGRQVIKGQHSLVIWVPTSKKIEGTKEENNYFVAGNVFDISQTEAIDQ